MIILPDRTQPRSRLLLPVHAREWRQSSQRVSRSGEDNRTEFWVNARVHDGFLVWRGVFHDRDDADAFLYALVRGSLGQERALWRLPTPEWHPGIGDHVSYEFATVTFLTTTGGGTNYAVPSDWNNSNNTIECVGAAGAASNLTGGGGGAYAKGGPLVLTPSSSVAYVVGTGAGSSNTYFNGASLAASSVGAQGGGGVTAGTAASSVGNIAKFSGGNGGNNNSGGGSGGGGGAGGPNGAGGTAGRGAVSDYGGGGGGGNGGGANGFDGGGTTGGAGGNGYLGTGGGVGNTQFNNGGPGTNGGGGGGSGGGGSTSPFSAGNAGQGSVGAEWGSTGTGSGGGGPGGDNFGVLNGQPGGNAVGPGGGGGGAGGGFGGGSNGAPGASFRGLIVVTYTAPVITGKSVTIASPSVSKAIKTASKSPSLSQSNSMVALRSTTPKLPVIQQPELITVVVPPPSHGNLINLVTSELLTIQKVSGRVLKAVMPELASLLRGVGTVRVINTVELATTLRKTSAPKAFMLSQSMAITWTNAISSHISLALLGLVSLVRNQSKRPFSFSMGEVFSVRRSSGKLVQPVNGQLLSLRNNLVKRVLINPMLLLNKTVVAGVGRINVTIGNNLRFFKAGQPKAFLGPMGLLASPLSIQMLKRVIISSGQLVLVPRLMSKGLWLTQGSVVTMTRRGSKLVRVAWAEMLTVLRPHEKFVIWSQTQGLRLVRRTGHKAAWGQAQALSLRRGAGHVMSFGQAQGWSLRRSLQHGVSLAQTQVISTGRNLRHVLSWAQVQAVSVRRGMGRRVSVSLAQVFLATARSVRRLVKIITTTTGQTVTAILRRGRFLGLNQAQAVTIRRRASKLVTFLWNQVVTLVPGPLVRRLNPSLFGLGLPRHRTVYEVPNVSQTNILQPPIEPDVEEENVQFDYGLTMAEGVKITAAVVTCSVYSGTDASPAIRLISYPVVGISKRTGRDAQAVIQTVGQMLNGVVYSLQCVATCDDGQELVLTSLLSCEASL